jgi:hypothetical protein
MKQLFYLIIVSSILRSPVTGFADINIPGGFVSGNWTLAESPYNIEGDITIHADSILTIEPGVEVIFQGLYSLQVNGALAAIGTEIDSISFSAVDTSVGWRGIRLSADADSSWISYTSIRYGRNTDGGGIYCPTPKAEITHCLITQNIASNKGGGICIDRGSSVDLPLINNCVITRNSARLGGGLYYKAMAMNISDCVISFNSASDVSEQANGGGLYLDGWFASSIQISNCMIENNFCDTDPADPTPDYGLGGGIYIKMSNVGGVLISNCRIETNWSTRSGGGLFSETAGIDVTNSTINGNYTGLCSSGGYPVRGGAAIGFAGMSHPSLLSHCEISGNSCYGYPGAIRVINTTKSLTLENCTVSKNWSVVGWSAIYSDGTVNLKNSIIAFNYGNGSGSGAIYSGANVSYCDFFDNVGGDIQYPPGGFAAVNTINANGDSCDVYGNIFLDPLFADTAVADYRLTWDNWPLWDDTRSPAIDAGDPAGLKDPDSTTSDMGVFYFNQLIPKIAVSDTLLDFGIVDVGQSLNIPFMIRNTGTAALKIESISNNRDVFSHDWSMANNLIPAGDSLEVMVSFTPVDSNLVADTLLIENNDRPVLVKLSGQGHVVTGIKDLAGLPKKYALYAAYPNPFNPVTNIEFDLPKNSNVELKIYNILGEEIITLISKSMNAGKHKYTWNANRLASGVYLYRIKAGGFNKVRKMILLR